MTAILRFVRAIPLLAVSPVVTLAAYLAVLAADLCWLIAGRKRPPAGTLPRTHAASVVIPNWNGRELLEKYLPSVMTATSGGAGHEVIVVDNGSTDGSVEFLRRQFPEVRVIALAKNLGFGAGSNVGFREAANDIVVLLNSDMRVDEAFLPPLLGPFQDDKVFAVSCQIFFSDGSRTREETGLTQGWWENGGLRVRHRVDGTVDVAFPCFYPGGGSSAFDRRKFLELGGFDELFRPFYLEDTDLGFRAWKRGWKVLYQPASRVWHEHRGTIGKTHSRAFIEGVIRKNFLLFAWKNVHEPGRLAGHFLFALAGAWISLAFGDALDRPNLAALARAFLQLPGAVRSRWRARSVAALDDTETFRRPLGGYYRDRFERLPAETDRPAVLFVSPYPICPPVHGGAVFMSQTCRLLAAQCQLHLLVMLDGAEEQAPHDDLVKLCSSADFLIRLEGQTHSFGSLLPHAIHELRHPDLEWVIHRQICLRRIDVIQLEYLPMAQFRCEFRQIAQVLFEHDVYFQSIGRQLPNMRGVLKRLAAGYEYLRALRYEMEVLPRFDRVQLCSASNRRFLDSFAPALGARLDDNLRAGIDTSLYPFVPAGRKPYTMLFLGSFRHAPNTEALYWFVHHSLPHVLAARSEARFVVIGSDPPPRYSLPDFGETIELRGYADDILAPLAENAVFLCPILSGSGVRVKLLEAFACGIPVVSTTIGAEGLASRDGEFCMLADDPRAFAERIVHLFDHPEEAESMARRARAEVESHWDMPVMTRALADSYRAVIKRKRQP